MIGGCSGDNVVFNGWSWLDSSYGIRRVGFWIWTWQCRTEPQNVCHGWGTFWMMYGPVVMGELHGWKLGMLVGVAVVNLLVLFMKSKYLSLLVILSCCLVHGISSIFFLFDCPNTDTNGLLAGWISLDIGFTVNQQPPINAAWVAIN